MNSITYLLSELERGEESAVAPLFAFYFRRLVRLANRRLRSDPALRSQDEDVALRAFHSLCRRIGDPNRPLRIASRKDFWWLLATRAASRAVDLARRHKATRSLSELDVDEIQARNPTPPVVAEMADECTRMLERLRDPELQKIALWKVEGWTDEEIAVKLGCVARTVERKIARIRACWQRDRDGGD